MLCLTLLNKRGSILIRQLLATIGIKYATTQLQILPLTLIGRQLSEQPAPLGNYPTICLAVSPSLKAWGISGRARLFEVVQRVSAINEDRRRNAPGWRLKAPSYDDRGVKADPSIAVGYITAPPPPDHG